MKYLSLLLISVLLLSCQREVDEQLPRETEQELLREIIYLDTTKPVGQDTADKASLTYDAQGRLIKVLMVEPLDDYTVLTEFFYQGNSKEAYLQVETSREDNDLEIDSTFYVYSNGIVNADSSIVWSKVPPGRPNLELRYRVANDYVVNGNKVKVSRRAYSYDWRSSAPLNYEETDMSFTILQSSGTIHEERCDESGGIVFSDYYKAVFTGAKNPYKGLLPVYPVHLADDNDGVLGKFEHYWASEQFGSGPNPYIISYRSQNRPDGYPLYIWQEDNWTPTIAYKIVFVYR